MRLFARQQQFEGFDIQSMLSRPGTASAALRKAAAPASNEKGGTAAGTPVPTVAPPAPEPSKSAPSYDNVAVILFALRLLQILQS